MAHSVIRRLIELRGVVDLSVISMLESDCGASFVAMDLKTAWLIVSIVACFIVKLKILLGIKDARSPCKHASNVNVLVAHRVIYFFSNSSTWHDMTILLCR